MIAPFLDLDEFERRGIDFRLKAAVVLVGAVDFVNSVIDLDVLQRPTPFLRHRADGVARLPVTGRNVAIVPCLGGGSGQDGEG